LERAAELLGKEHYMYTVLQARRHFFEGITLKKRSDKQLSFHKALSLQPEMAHAMVYLARTFKSEQLDSVEYYIQKAKVLIPSWVEPYIVLAYFYDYRLKQYDNAKESLLLAGQIDSTSVLIWYEKAKLYDKYKKYEAAEKWYLKIIAETGKEICFPCAYFNLGQVYKATNRYEKAEKYFKKAIQLDSTFIRGYQSFRECLYYHPPL